MTGPNTTRHRAADLARLQISPNLRAISVAEGVRAALAVAVIIAANQYLHWAPLGEASLAALLACISDPGGPIRRRVPVLLSFTFAGALLVAGIGLARHAGPAIALPLTVAVVFCAPLLRVYGQPQQQLGTLLSVVAILAFDVALPNLPTAAALAASFIGGGLWATLLTMVIWRVHPFLPARASVAESYRRLAALVTDLRGMLRDADERSWEGHARAQRGKAREAIEAARAAVQDTLRTRGVHNNRAAQSLIRLEAAEQIFGALIALSDLLEHTRPASPVIVLRLLRRLGPTLLVLARAIPHDDASANRRVGRAIEAMDADLRMLPADDPLHPVLQRILERLRMAHTLTTPAYLPAGITATGDRVPVHQRLLAPLRANLTWHSPALRHALRSAVVATPALLLTLLWFTPYDHWLTITLVVTMQPYYAPTYSRALERIIGTAAGGILAAIIGMVCTTPLSIAIAMFPLAVIAMGLRAVSLGVFMLGLTPLIVLLVEAAEPHTSELLIAFARAAFTVLGGLGAVGASLVLWPARASDDLTPEVRTAILAHAAYAEAEMSLLLGETTAAVVDEARRGAGLASNTLEAAISLALQEPGTRDRDRLDAALVMDAALRRCAGRIGTLRFDGTLASTVLPAAERAWRDWIASGLRRLAAGDPTIGPRPEVPASDGLLRIARQIELMAGTLPRLV